MKTILIFKKKGMMVDGIVAHNFDWSECVLYLLSMQVASPISDSKKKEKK